MSPIINYGPMVYTLECLPTVSLIYINWRSGWINVNPEVLRLALLTKDRPVQ